MADHECKQEGRIHALEGWEERQNGSLLRIEEKVDKIMFRMVAGMGTLAFILVGYIVEEAIRGNP